LEHVETLFSMLILTGTPYRLIISTIHIQHIFTMYKNYYKLYIEFYTKVRVRLAIAIRYQVEVHADQIPMITVENRVEFVLRWGAEGTWVILDQALFFLLLFFLFYHYIPIRLIN